MTGLPHPAVGDPDRGVSPVVGVVMLLAIVVILAGVVGTFVFGLGEEVASTTPSATFAFEYDEGSAYNLTIRHTGGDPFTEETLTTTGTDGCEWDAGGGERIRAGSTCSTNIEAELVNVVWIGDDRSVVLASYEAPTT